MVAIEALQGARGPAPPLTGSPEEVAEIFREFARAGVSHLQVIPWPHTLAGLEAFRPVLEALDQDGSLST